MQTLGSVTSQEAYKQQMTMLQSMMGRVIVVAPSTSHLEVDTELDPEFDRAALHALKARIRAEQRR